MQQLAFQTRFLRMLLGFFTLTLVLSTHPLWTTPPSFESPQIPWHSSLINVPFSVDTFALIGLGISCLGLVTLGAFPAVIPYRRPVGLCYLLCLGTLVAFDQHRLQPWVIQFLLLGGLITCANGTDLVRGWKWIVISIYLWSALSKFDYAFLTHQGPMFLEGLLKPFGKNLSDLPQNQIFYICLLFPTCELLAALLLMKKSLVRYGLVLSILMHVGLLWILGVGLKHEWGVITWNVFFIFQNVTLFRTPKRNSLEPSDHVEFSTSPQIVPAVYRFLAVSYPLLMVIHRCDHWPAWQVYCSRPPKVRFMILEKYVDRVPEHLKAYLGTPELLSDRIPLNLDAWSYENRFCPIYPQPRYRYSLANAFLRDAIPDDGLITEITLPPNRFTGESNSFYVVDLDKMRLETTVLNTEPRSAIQIRQQQ